MKKLLFLNLFLIFSYISLAQNIVLMKSGNSDADLLIAAYENDLEAMKIALKQGEDVNCRSKEGGVTPLMYAAQNGFIKGVKLLIEAGADISLKNYYDGGNALHDAVRFNHFDVAEYLIRCGANPNSIDDYLCEPIFYSVAYGYYWITDMLIYYGANVNNTSYNGINLLSLCVQNSDTLMLELLFNNQAKTTKADDNYYENYPELFYSVYFQNHYISYMLIDNEAKINDQKYNIDPWYLALKNYDYAHIELLKKCVDTIKPSKIFYDEIYKNYKANHKDSLKKIGIEYSKSMLPYGVIIENEFVFNLKDFHYGINLGIFDIKYRLGCGIGWNTRFGRKTIITEYLGETYQYKEYENALYAFANKHFPLYYNKQDEIGIKISAKAGWNYANIKGLKYNPANKFYFAINAGAYFLNYKNTLNAHIMLDYSPSVYDYISSFSINIGLNFIIPLKYPYDFNVQKAEWL